MYFLTIDKKINMICNSLQRPKYFQYDGAPPHRTTTALEILWEEFDGRLIGIGGAIQWPPRSPDLSPLHFSVWRTIKNAVYRYENEDTIDNFKHTISQKCQDIFTPEVLQNIRREFVERLQHCIDHDGLQFEQNLDWKMQMSQESNIYPYLGENERPFSERPKIITSKNSPL